MQLSKTKLNNLIGQLSEDRQGIFMQLRQTIVGNIPNGFEEVISGNIIAYQVPLDTYPAGYHCSENTPLPFVSIASQKNFMALYHMGIYMNSDLLNWFESEYPKHSKYKLNMGKSCIRFKKMDAIPFELIAELMGKISVKDYIQIYEKAFKQ